MTTPKAVDQQVLRDVDVRDDSASRVCDLAKYLTGEVNPNPV
jgi:hypothetical protein